MRVLFLGDVVGKSGCRAIGRALPRLIDKDHVDLAIVNGENAVEGAGLDASSVHDLMSAGAHVVTSGNHIWRRAGIADVLDQEARVLRPANFPNVTPGRGWVIIDTADGTPVLVINVIGRVFMQPSDCPFQTLDTLLRDLRHQVRVIIVDVHAEATSEKAAIACWLDGKVSAVFGSHTHVQTADERILPGGTAFITDVGMCGPADSVIGVRSDLAIQRFRTQMPVRFEVASGPVLVQGALADIDPETGRASEIRRIREMVAV